MKRAELKKGTDIIVFDSRLNVLMFGAVTRCTKNRVCSAKYELLVKILVKGAGRAVIMRVPEYWSFMERNNGTCRACVYDEELWKKLCNMLEKARLFGKDVAIISRQKMYDIYAEMEELIKDKRCS